MRQAIRTAAGRPSGRESLALPPLARLEATAGPKQLLHESLKRANGATGRRAERFDSAAAIHRLADLVEDWAPLRALPAFRRLEEDTRAALTELGLPVVRTPPSDAP